MTESALPAPLSVHPGDGELHPDGPSGQAEPSLAAPTGLETASPERVSLEPASNEPTARGATVPMPMTKPVSKALSKPGSAQTDTPSGAPSGPSPKPPFVYLSGALTSALMAWLCLLFSQRVVLHFSLHPPHYSARMAQSIATALKTLIVGMGFLSTFSCAFVALGLFLVFIRSLSRAKAPEAS